MHQRSVLAIEGMPLLGTAQARAMLFFCLSVQTISSTWSPLSFHTPLSIPSLNKALEMVQASV